MCMKILNFIIMGRVPSTLHGKRWISAKAVASLKVVLIIVDIASSVKKNTIHIMIPGKITLILHIIFMIMPCI